MSLCSLAWRNIKKFNRHHDRRFVHIAAATAELLCVDLSGDRYVYHRRSGTFEREPGWETITAKLLSSGAYRESSDPWAQEIARRVAELEAQAPT